MDEVGWYYDGGGQPVGPLGQAALVELVRAGQIAPGTRVWRPGLAAWTAWETVPELAALVSPPPAGPPPLAPPPAAAPFSGNSHAGDVLAGAGAGALHPKAPLGARLLAALVDVLVTLPAGLLWILVVAAFVRESTGLGWVLALAALAASIWALLYTFTKDGRPGGQSIGKRAMGLMVVHLESNRPCTTGQSALRYLVVFALSLMLGAGWLVELIVLLVTPGGRRLGDFAAGTQVIRAADHRPGR